MKGRQCADGRKQRMEPGRKDATSPTAALESPPILLRSAFAPAATLNCPKVLAYNAESPIATRPEEEVLEYMAYTDLKTSRQIADHLDLSPNTIRNHKNSINRKAKQVFPLNNFSDTNDVILYLRRQLMM